MRCKNDRIKKISKELREMVVIGTNRRYNRAQR